MRIPWKPCTFFDESILQDPDAADARCTMFIDSTFDDNMDQLMDDCFFTAPIKESLYKTVCTQGVLNHQKHLNSTQLGELKSVLDNFTSLFNGNLVTRSQQGSGDIQYHILTKGIYGRT
jgi:hypothetical protein